MQSKRKDDHIKEALKQEVLKNDFDNIYFKHHALPEFDIDDITLEATYLNNHFNYPFYINAMTGGSEQATIINEKLAKIAQKFGLMMVVGSQSIALKNPEYINSFAVIRKHFDGFLVANISANASVENAVNAVKMINANALSIHINSVQELVMPEGDRTFKHWLENIKAIKNALNIPVIVKEVGFGLSAETVGKLMNIGIHYVDVSGKGGTNFALIENNRGGNMNYLNNWGISTVEALIENKDNQVEKFASGGIRNALDIVKSLVLGAKAVGLSKYFLNIATSNSFDESFESIDRLITEIKKIMVLLSVKDIEALKEVEYIIKKG